MDRYLTQIKIVPGIPPYYTLVIINNNIRLNLKISLEINHDNFILFSSDGLYLLKDENTFP